MCRWIYLSEKLSTSLGAHGNTKGSSETTLPRKEKKIKNLILANEKQNVKRKKACAFEILKRGKGNE